MVVPAGPPAGLGTGGWEAKSPQSRGKPEAQL